MRFHKLTALAMAAVFAAGTLTGCGGSDKSADSTGAAQETSGDKVSFTIFNSKTEIQEYLAGKIDRATLAKDIQDYWAAVTPVEH